MQLKSEIMKLWWKRYIEDIISQKSPYLMAPGLTKQQHSWKEMGKNLCHGKIQERISQCCERERNGNGTSSTFRFWKGNGNSFQFLAKDRKGKNFQNFWKGTHHWRCLCLVFPHLCVILSDVCNVAPAPATMAVLKHKKYSVLLDPDFVCTFKIMLAFNYLIENDQN